MMSARTPGRPHKTQSVFDRYNITSTDDVRATLEAVRQPQQPTHE